MIDSATNPKQSTPLAIKASPSVSIFLPFEPKMFSRKDLELKWQSVIEKVESELSGKYDETSAKAVVNRLRQAVKELDYGTFKQSLALFVSAEIQKAYYLDIPLEEKIIVDGRFEIRDLVFSKKDIHKYLILVLSGHRSRIFLGNTVQFMRIAFNTSENIEALQNDIPERVANFTDISGRKEVMLDKFLHHIDSGLGHILKAYSLPLFVMGTDRTIGHFKAITHYNDKVIQYIHGNYEDAGDSEIREAIKPYVADWKKVKQDDLLQRLDVATGAKKIVSGMDNVMREAEHKRGRLLVVEKNYTCFNHPTSSVKGGHIKDDVDEAIEKVIENGGDVEFVDEGLLDQYEHIALTLYY